MCIRDSYIEDKIVNEDYSPAAVLGELKAQGKEGEFSVTVWDVYKRQGNGYTQELTAYEKTRLVERTKAALIRAKEEDGLEIQGKMRDLVAAMINESSTNVARMDAINNNATPEIKEQLKEGNLGITACLLYTSSFAK